MGKKRPGKSVRNNPNTNQEPDEFVNAPHSFIIHRGLADRDVEDLTKDFRKVMAPFTAESLKEKRNNTIKDFVHVASALHVSHLCIFSRSDLGVYMKLGKIPRGPTLTFKIHNFALAKDVISSLKKQLVIERAFKNSPLIVLNNFSGEGMQFKLMASMFQNMFPTLNLCKIDLNNVRRVVMLNYNTGTKLIDFRHYTIKVVPVGISKAVKKIVGGKVPDLSKCEDISEFLTKSGLLSESEAEDDANAHVILSQKMATRGNVESGKSAIRLVELGPRLTLQLIKIEDGLMDGEVLYHELVHKTEEEKAAIRKAREAKKKLKEKRKKIQDENTKRKEAQKEELKEKSLQGMKKKFGIEVDTPSVVAEVAPKQRNQEDEVAEDDDAQYYREEVGEEPDQDLFSSRRAGFKRPKTFHSYKNKRPRFDEPAKSRRDGSGGGDSRDRTSSKFAFGNKGNDGSNKKSFGNSGNSGNRNANNGFKGNKKKRGGDRTNADKRDFRPIGVKSGVRKFSSNKEGRPTNSKRTGNKKKRNN